MRGPRASLRGHRAVPGRPWHSRCHLIGQVRRIGLPAAALAHPQRLSRFACSVTVRGSGTANADAIPTQGRAPVGRGDHAGTLAAGMSADQDVDDELMGRAIHAPVGRFLRAHRHGPRTGTRASRGADADRDYERERLAVVTAVERYASEFPMPA